MHFHTQSMLVKWMIQILIIHSQLSKKAGMCSHKLRSFHQYFAEDLDRSKSSGDLQTVHGTQKIHDMLVWGEGTLQVRQYSCFCGRCIQGTQCANPFLGSYRDVLLLPARGGRQQRRKRYGILFFKAFVLCCK